MPKIRKEECLGRAQTPCCVSPQGFWEGGVTSCQHAPWWNPSPCSEPIECFVQTVLSKYFVNWMVVDQPSVIYTLQTAVPGLYWLLTYWWLIKAVFPSSQLFRPSDGYNFRHINMLSAWIITSESERYANNLCNIFPPKEADKINSSFCHPSSPQAMTRFRNGTANAG